MPLGLLRLLDLASGVFYKLELLQGHRVAMSGETGGYFDYIIPAVVSADTVMIDVKIAFFSGLMGFLGLLLYISISCKMFFGAKAARRVMALARVLIVCELMLMVWLLDWSLNYDNLANRSSQPKIVFSTSYTVSYIHHWPRAAFGMVFLGVGMFGDLHPAPCIIACLACIYNILFDSVSAVEVRDHLSAVIQYASPSGDYTKDGLLTYYYRDIVSIAFSSAIMFCVLQYLVLVGFFQPQLIPLDVMMGGEENRSASMRRDRTQRMKTQIEHGVANGKVELPEEEDMPLRG